VDFLSIVGLVGSVTCVITAMLLDGGSVKALLQLSAFIIVFGGTIGAVLLQTPMKTFLLGVKMIMWVFLPPKDDRAQLVEEILGWLRIARRQFVLALDPIAEQQTDPFIKQGLRLVVDGIEASQIRAVLESTITTQEHEETMAHEMYEAMGGYAPTVGILGAVLGLITVMSHLDDPSKLGEGIATAFVATVYGVGGANLLFLPISNKLKVLVKRRIRRLEMVTEAMVGMAIMEPPIQFELKLRSFLEGEPPPRGAGGEDEGAAPPPNESELLQAS
jgi:chemotaxis protein MotA